VSCPEAGHFGLLRVAIANAIVSLAHSAWVNFDFDLLSRWGDIHKLSLH